MDSVENTDEKGGGVRNIVSQPDEPTNEPTLVKMAEENEGKKEEDRALVRQIQAILVSRDAQTDVIRAEMATQMDPEKINREAQAVAEMEVKGTQTESRIEEMKIQRLVEHSNIEHLLELGQHEDSLLQK